jgi:cyclopropane fatty-acyl-phospholipid synthase-like methyltransferase
MLDAGSGNGYFSWLAYQSGANVFALNFDGEQVKKAREFLLGYRQAIPRCAQAGRQDAAAIQSVQSL